MINLLFQIERGGTMIQARPIISSPHSSEIEAVNYLTVADSPIDLRYAYLYSDDELKEFIPSIRTKERIFVDGLKGDDYN
jgi:hypothetical protein